MPTIVTILTYLTISLLLSIPLAYILVALFKRRIERRINSYNNFKQVKNETQLITNNQPLPQLEKIALFPTHVRGFSFLQELPMIAAVFISSLVANYLWFPVGTESDIVNFIIYFLFTCFPLVYYFLFLYEHQHIKKRVLRLIMLGVVLVAWLFAFVKSGNLFDVVGLLYFYGYSSVLVISYVIFPRIKEIIFALLPPVFFAVVLIFQCTTILGTSEAARYLVINQIFSQLNRVGLASYSADAVVIILILLLVALFTLLLFIVRFAYIKKWFNNTLFLFDIIWVIHISLVISGGERSPYGLLVLGTFLLYKLIFYVLSFILNSSKKGVSKKSLLVLRVFSLNSESALMFKKIQSFWRYQGPIHLIAGYDLTATTIDVDDLLTFISGGMKRRFNLSVSLINKNMQDLDEEADINGHYRVNEMYCNNATWKVVVDRLVNKVDFVLMDIRSFSRKNAGCAHEIKELIHKVPLASMCFIVDQRTDIDFLKECAIEAWQKLPIDSPNLTLPEDSKILLYQHASEMGLSKFLS